MYMNDDRPLLGGKQAGERCFRLDTASLGNVWVEYGHVCFGSGEGFFWCAT